MQQPQNARATFASILSLAWLLVLPLTWQGWGVDGARQGAQGTGRGSLTSRQGLDYLLQNSGEVLAGRFVERAPSADLRDILPKGKRSFDNSLARRQFDILVNRNTRVYGEDGDRLIQRGAGSQGREDRAFFSNRSASPSLAARTSNIYAHTVIQETNQLTIKFYLDPTTRLPSSARLIFGDRLSFIRPPVPLVCAYTDSSVAFPGQMAPVSASLNPGARGMMYIGDVTACVRASLVAGESDVTMTLLLPCAAQPALCAIDSSPALSLML